ETLWRGGARPSSVGRQAAMGAMDADGLPPAAGLAAAAHQLRRLSSTLCAGAPLLRDVECACSRGQTGSGI
ncbi:MAG: hypothetical protein ACXU84_07820, partial [Xanthobacteraceae bacterium]